MIKADRFWALVPLRPSQGCWLWEGKRERSGYGSFRVGSMTNKTRTTWKAHRVAWTLTNGAIPSGMYICHRCDNPPCVRPDHLFLGTPYDNRMDAIAKGRAALGSRHGRSPFSEADVVAIRATPTRRGILRRLAEHYGVTPAAIRNIRTGKTWQSVPLGPHRQVGHGNAKLDPAAVLAIRSAPRGRGLQKALATRYGVSRSCITFVRAGRTWTATKSPPGLASPR